MTAAGWVVALGLAAGGETACERDVAFAIDAIGDASAKSQKPAKLLVKNAWSNAAKAGIKPGMEVVKVDSKPAAEWMKQRVAELADTISFSTDQQAFFFACHWGLAFPKGTKL